MRRKKFENYLAFTVENAIYEKLKAVTNIKFISISEFVRKAVREKLDRLEGEPKPENICQDDINKMFIVGDSSEENQK